MRARAEVSVELARDGRPRLWLHSEAPLVLRRTGVRDSCCVHLLGGAGGPLGGDDLTLQVRVGPGATLTLRSVAAMLAQPDAAGRQSLTVVDVELGEDATLDWAPEPLVVTRDARHRQLTSVKCDAGSALRWRDVTVLGRHGEQGGTVEQRLAVNRAGEELLDQTQCWGAEAPRGWAGPAGTATARVVASLLTVGMADQHGLPAPTVSAATLELAGGGRLRTAMGADVTSVLRDLAAGGSLEEPPGQQVGRPVAGRC